MELLCYCARQGNGGTVPPGVVDVIRHVTPQFLDRCYQLELLDLEYDGEYVIHDWSVYNPKDPTAAARMERYRSKHKNGSVTAGVTEGVTENA